MTTVIWLCLLNIRLLVEHLCIIGSLRVLSDVNAAGLLFVCCRGTTVGAGKCGLGGSIMAPGACGVLDAQSNALGLSGPRARLFVVRVSTCVRLVGATTILIPSNIARRRGNGTSEHVQKWQHPTERFCANPEARLEVTESGYSPVVCGHESVPAGGFACDSPSYWCLYDSDPRILVYFDEPELTSCYRGCDGPRDTGCKPGIPGVTCWCEDGIEAKAETIMHWLDMHDFELCKFEASHGDLSEGDSLCCDPIANVTVSCAL